MKLLGQDRHWMQKTLDLAEQAKNEGIHPENPTLDLPCRTVLDAGQREIEVIGPVMEEQAAHIHHGAW